MARVFALGVYVEVHYLATCMCACLSSMRACVRACVRAWMDGCLRRTCRALAGCGQTGGWASVSTALQPCCRARGQRRGGVCHLPSYQRRGTGRPLGRPATPCGAGRAGGRGPCVGLAPPLTASSPAPPDGRAVTALCARSARSSSPRDRWCLWRSRTTRRHPQQLVRPSPAPPAPLYACTGQSSASHASHVRRQPRQSAALHCAQCAHAGGGGGLGLGLGGRGGVAAPEAAGGTGADGRPAARPGPAAGAWPTTAAASPPSWAAPPPPLRSPPAAASAPAFASQAAQSASPQP